MAVSPILLNATIQQSNDVLQNQTKQIEKGMVDQSNILQREVKKEQQLAKQVVKQDDVIFSQERYDAKEKGHGSYSGDGGKKRKNVPKEGRVINKSEGSFDIKI
ncbi:MAG: hypothetical protein II193_01335 [Lachnospiraceae bacterium]|nr:hypothetical protein [Lachnospiraceae bacterium]